MTNYDLGLIAIGLGLCGFFISGLCIGAEIADMIRDIESENRLDKDSEPVNDEI